VPDRLAPSAFPIPEITAVLLENLRGLLLVLRQGKDQQGVRLIARPGVWICQECVALCQQILHEETDRQPGVA
jgi:hypothetical protein